MGLEDREIEKQEAKDMNIEWQEDRGQGDREPWVYRTGKQRSRRETGTHSGKRIEDREIESRGSR